MSARICFRISNRSSSWDTEGEADCQTDDEDEDEDELFLCKKARTACEDTGERIFLCPVSEQQPTTNITLPVSHLTFTEMSLSEKPLPLSLD